jgi:pyridoxine 4-dehydrogenase
MAGDLSMTLRMGRVARSGVSDLARIAERHQATPAQVALAWLLHRSPTMLLIPGTGSIAHFDENLGALSLRLSPEEFAALR